MRTSTRQATFDVATVVDASTRQATLDVATVVDASTSAATSTRGTVVDVTAVGVAAGSVAAVAVTAMPCLAQPPSATTRALLAADNKRAGVVACLTALAAIAELQSSTAWPPRRLYRLHFVQHGSELINFTKSGLSSSQVSPYLAIDFGVGTRL